MASPQDAAAVERLEEAAVDGRTEGIRYRQDQLQSLHAALRDAASDVCAALAKDSLASAAEVETEFYLAMDAVRHFYESLDFDKELEDEYSVARGKNHGGRRVGAGIVVIRPTTHTRFFSIVTPLAAAIAAGNCIILEVRQSPLTQPHTMLTRLSSSSTQL
jgi:acyl-CoA reductase-like NAD-dependent aldehyde dehydrogenase